MEIPQTLKSRVLAQWLFTGLSRDEIALANNISQGAVSAIIQEARETVHDLDLMRELAVGMKKACLNIIDLSSALRINNKLDKLGINPELAESIIEKVHVHCYVNNLQVEKLLVLITKQIEQVESYGISLADFGNVYSEKLAYLLRCDKACKEMTEKRNILARAYNTTVPDLEEFQALKPIHEKWRLAVAENIQKDKIIIDLRRQLEEKKSNQPY
jgi:predicted DNA-binding protein YlxM (UPF0122 family)